MDPITIAASAAALFGPFLRKAAEEFAGEAGKSAWAGAKSLWQKLRSNFHDDPVATHTLDRFAHEPDAQGEAFRDVIAKRLALDPALARELSVILDTVKRSGPGVRVVQAMQEAEDVVGIKTKALRRGAVEVRQTVAGKASGVTGVDIDEIG
jgi:hypothetical protein